MNRAIWNKGSSKIPIIKKKYYIRSNFTFRIGYPLIGKGLYHFPYRLLPEIFSIHIVFTLIGLPILTMIFLYCYSQAHRWGRVGIIICVSLLMPIFEKIAERLGMFVHSDKWMHLYSFFGYLLFFTIISGVYFWLKKRSG
ncbi:CBO0543 family protein [Paenibacillus thiaminolyticus]|uniref:CBO0543 family protein n=1 Tax=Paenibacillus thiaminolyticus TaxID=49283 RepID=UPI0025431F1E|nr:CBO0543 family protein [Paenibacillus thiaminolyticus]